MGRWKTVANAKTRDGASMIPQRLISVVKEILNMFYPKHESEPVPPRHITPSYSRFPMPAKRYSIHSLEYLATRGISLPFVEKVHTMYPTEMGICFMLEGGVCFQERITSPQRLCRRFRSQYGSEMGGCVYSPGVVSVFQCPLLVVTEGTADALVIEQEGLRAISLLGTSLTKEKLHLVRQYPSERLYYIPDNDVPGLYAANEIIRELGAEVYLVPLEYKDAAAVPMVRRAQWLAPLLSRLGSGK